MFESITQRIRRNPFFSAIYILGSALSIASAMLIVVFIYVKTADIYPESDRSNIYILENCVSKEFRSSSSASTSGHIGNGLHEKLLKAIGPYAITISTECIVGEPFEVEPDDGSLPFGVVTRLVDDSFFKVFDLEVLAGATLQDADLESGLSVAVISDRLARRLYGSVDSAVGRELSVNYQPYSVCGVVREPSFLMQQSFGQVFVPWSANLPAWWRSNEMNITGHLKIRVRVADAEAGGKMTDAVDETLRLTAATMPNKEHADSVSVTLECRPITSQAFGMPARFDWGEVMKRYGFMVLILLLVPAFNLSGMIAGNMETRLPEMGVRKSFGARRGRLFRSVLAENFRLTAMGGVIGLSIAAMFVWLWRDWMFFLDDSVMADAPESVSVIITSDMLFAPTVFILAFTVTFLLNFLSAMIPVWLSLRQPIVESLSETK